MRLAVVAALEGNTSALSALLADAGRRGAEHLLLLPDGTHRSPDELSGVISDQIRRSMSDDLALLTIGSLPAGLGPLGRRPPAWACGALAPGDLSALSAVPQELTRAGLVTFSFSGSSDDEYRAAAATLLATRPDARICLGLYQPQPAVVTVNRDGTVQRTDRTITASIHVEQLTFVCPGALGRRREDAGMAGWASIDSETSTVELHRVQYAGVSPPVERAGSQVLDAHTARVAAQLRAWLSGAPQHAA